MRGQGDAARDFRITAGGSGGLWAQGDGSGPAWYRYGSGAVRNDFTWASAVVLDPAPGKVVRLTAGGRQGVFVGLELGEAGGMIGG